MMQNIKLSMVPIFLQLLLLSGQVQSATPFPIKGFAIAAPEKAGLDQFIDFMDEELGPRGVNTLILRVDYNYEFESHPELRNPVALSREDVKKIVAAGNRNGIDLIPQINLLGHQSWAGELGNLLKVYPEFDETPQIKMPENYEWPNEDGLYCKSYCPLHPEVHEVVFALVDEIVEVFEADAFHAGMDEVFYIGNDGCPRCSGLDKATLFAGEVSKIRNHLYQQGKRLWIWGDRLIDGKTTGIGMWEASMNLTHRAIDLIPKDVMICDWHYVKPVQTPVLFAMKGFDVVSCSWNKPAVGVQHVEDMVRLKSQHHKEMEERFKGVILTVWSGAGPFINGLKNYQSDPENLTEEETEQAWVTFVRMFDKIKLLSQE